MYKKTLILATVVTAALATVSPAKAESSGFLYWGTGTPHYKSAPDVRHIGRYVKPISNSFTVEEKAIIRTTFNEMYGDRNRHYDRYGYYDRYDRDSRYDHHNSRYDYYERDRDHHYKNKKKVSYGYSNQSREARDLQRYIDRTGALPHHVKTRDLPRKLTHQLPRRERHQDIVWVYDDIYLVDKRTHAVLDVIYNVAR